MKFVKNTSFAVLFVLLLMGIMFSACNDSKDEEVRLDEENAAERIDNVNQSDSLSADTTAAMENQIQGTWTGTFDGRNSTLDISEQNENEFTGKISTAYKNQLVKRISGQFNKEDNTFTMRDTERGKFAGTYSGKLSDNMTKMEGTFTLKTDNSKYRFTFTKK